MVIIQLLYDFRSGQPGNKWAVSTYTSCLYIQTYYITHNSWTYQNHGPGLIQSSLCVCFQSEWSWISRDSRLHPPSISLLKHCLLEETQKANSRAWVAAFWKNRSSTFKIWTFRKAVTEVVLIDLWRLHPQGCWGDCHTALAVLEISAMIARTFKSPSPSKTYWLAFAGYCWDQVLPALFFPEGVNTTNYPKQRGEFRWSE